MKRIETDLEPKAIGPYSQGVMANNTLYVSGQIPFDSKTMKEIEKDIAIQTKQSLKNILAIIKAAGLSKQNIVKCGIFMSDLANFSEMNKAYQTFFGEHKPADSRLR